MATQSRADAVWQGSLTEGRGTVKLASGAAGTLNVSWPARIDRATAGTQTSPEELIAAAHASCFAMALSHALAGQGHPPRELDVSASVEFGEKDGGPAITNIQLRVQGDVPGMDEQAFREAANGAKDGCPVSKALKGNVNMSVEATLKS